MKEYQVRHFEDISVGQRALTEKCFTELDINTFAGISGDFNPLHLDESYASESRFKKRIVHGFLVASLFSNLLGTKLPGYGTIYTSQTLNFLYPVYINDVITAVVEVTEKNSEKKRIVLKTWCENQSRRCVLDGVATVLFDPKASKIIRRSP